MTLDLSKLVGQKVHHKQYGPGVVTEIEDEEFIKVQFGEEIKTFTPYTLMNRFIVLDDESLMEDMQMDCILSEKERIDNALKPYLKELDNMTGLAEIKEQINDLVCEIKISKMRKAFKLKVPEVTRHMVFIGNPGTGKTTVARMLANIFKVLGVVSIGQLVEVDRSGLVAAYAGQTALKTKKVIESAIGGVLFIDEAYAICRNNNDEYGYEALDTLTKCLEDYRDDLIIVVAGYKKEMQDFLKANPGLSSRFKTLISFNDYSNKELAEIFLSLLRENDYHLDKEAASETIKYFKSIDILEGNARSIRNMFENTIKLQARRINEEKHISANSLSEIKVCDLPFLQPEQPRLNV